jgi:hypothetical protein
MNHAHVNFNNIDAEHNSFIFYIMNQIITTKQDIATHSFKGIYEENLEQLLKIEDYLISHKLDELNSHNIISIINNYIENKDINNIKELYSSHIKSSPDKIQILNRGLHSCLNMSKPKIQIANFLIKSGANINDPLLENCFIRALTLNHSNITTTNIIEFMIKNNYDINKDIYGKNLDNVLTFYSKKQ